MTTVVGLVAPAHYTYPWPEVTGSIFMDLGIGKLRTGHSHSVGNTVQRRRGTLESLRGEKGEQLTEWMDGRTAKKVTLWRSRDPARNFLLLPSDSLS